MERDSFHNFVDLWIVVILLVFEICFGIFQMKTLV